MGIDSVWDWLVGLLDGWMGLVLVGWYISSNILLKVCFCSRTRRKGRPPSKREWAPKVANIPRYILIYTYEGVLGRPGFMHSYE